MSGIQTLPASPRRWALAAALSLLACAARAEDYGHYNKALDAYQHQIYLTAISEARAQLRDTPNHAPSWVLISRVYLKLKQCSNAGEAAAAATNILAQAQGTAPRQELDETLGQLDAECGPSLEMGRAFVQAKDFGKASAYYKGYVEKHPGDLDARLEYARLLSWTKDYPGASEQFRRYLKARPGDVQAIQGLSDVHAWSGDLHAAEEELKTALAREPSNVDALVRLGHVYEWEGEYPSAKTAYDRALALSPSNDGAREGAERVKDLKSVRKRRETAADILAKIEQSGDVSQYLTLGDAYYFNEGKVEEALAAYRRYLKEFPNDAKAKLKLARVLGWEKRYDESTQLLREYLAKHPEDYGARLELADALAWQGRRLEALAELEGIERDNPSFPDAYVAAGDVLRWEGDYPESRDKYRKALQLDPGNARATEGLREIERRWNPAPTVHAATEGVAESDIRFRRITEELGASFHLDDGRIGLSPGVRNHHFSETGLAAIDAREAYLQADVPIQEQWRWKGEISGLDIMSRQTKLQASLAVEGSISTHTWMSFGYVGRDAVFENNNLLAISSGTSVRLDSFNLEFARTFRGDNEVRGFVSAGFLSDANSRARLFLKVLHQLDDAPIIKVGPVFKALSFSRTSPFYWSPQAYSGPGVTAELERRWEDLSYRASVTMFRIVQNSSNEASVEGALTYHPLRGWFAQLTAQIAREAGASPVGSTNAQYRNAFANVGYKF